MLGLTRNEVHSLFAEFGGRLEPSAGQEHGIDAGNGAHATLPREICEIVHFLKESEFVDLGKNKGGEAFGCLLPHRVEGGKVKASAGRVNGGDGEFDLGFPNQGIEDLAIFVEEATGKENSGSTGIRPDGAGDGLEKGGGTVVEGGVDGLEAGQGGEGALVDPMGDQGTLASLGLIGCVGGRKWPQFGDGIDDGVSFPGWEEVADEGVPELCLLGKGEQLCDRLVVLQFLGEVRALLKDKGLVDVAEQFAGIGQADRVEHGTDFILTCRDVVPLRFPGEFRGVIVQVRATPTVLYF